MSKKSKGCIGCLVFPVFVLAGLGIAFWSSLLPTARDAQEYVRYTKRTQLANVLTELESKGVIRSAWSAQIYARLKKFDRRIAPGTYVVKPGETIDETFQRLKSPIKQIVTLPEGWWIKRTAARLASKDVCTEQDYVDTCKSYIDLDPLSSTFPRSNLEGRLFPDSYDLPPLTTAKEIVEMQLRAFKKKAWPKLQQSRNPQQTLTIASLVELEAATDKDRGLIAGVIMNRLSKGMPLQIDATVLYALQEWKQLPPGVVRTVNSPYNTYLNKGLPPGPIGSPGLKSIEAALHPVPSGYLYYVARPNRSHFFATNYPDHLKNIKIARSEARGAQTP